MKTKTASIFNIPTDLSVDDLDWFERLILILKKSGYKFVTGHRPCKCGGIMLRIEDQWHCSKCKRIERVGEVLLQTVKRSGFVDMDRHFLRVMALIPGEIVSSD